MEDIKEKEIKNSIKPVSIEATEKILRQMKNCVCKIHNGKNKATGFFAKIPYYNDLLNVLITNNHVLGESDIADGQNITISLNNETIIKDIILDSNRKRYTNKTLDVTIIEIREKEDNINDFLLLDKQIINLINKKSNTNNEKFLNNLYENESIYLLNYMNGEKIFSPYGLLKEIQQDEIYHQCFTDLGSSGSPILLLKNNQVIGVHFGAKKKIEFNLGTLLVKPIIEFQQKYLVKIKNEISDNIKSISNIASKNLISQTNKIMNNKNEINKDKIKDCKIKIKTEKVYNCSILDFENLNFENLLGLSIDFKRGFYNYGTPESSKLNSLIQILTSIKEIHDDLRYSKYNIKSKQDIINKFKNIYVFTSFFLKALNEIYKIGKPDEYVSLKQMDILLKFIDKDLTSKSIYDYLMIILELLHQEFLSYPNNIPCQDKLISFNSPYGQFENSKNIFYDYYNNEYKKSKISELFNWISRERKTCKNCYKSTFSFQSFPILSLNLDSMDEFLTKNKLYTKNMNQTGKKFTLDECLKLYSIIDNDYNLIEYCIFCQKEGVFYHNNYFQTSPKYLFIDIYRTKTIKLIFPEEFKLQKDEGSDLKYTKYKLAGFIMKEENNNYSCVLKQNEYHDGKGIIVEEWKKFIDETIVPIKFIKNEKDDIEESKVFHPLNAEILLYKAI